MGAVVVTGASGNLGSVVCGKLLAAGREVFALVRSEKDRGPLASALIGVAGADAKARLRVEIAELASEASVEAAYESAGALAGAVHCAGGFEPGKLVDTSLETFEKMIALNLRTTFLCCRAAAKRLQPGGRIVNVAAYGPAIGSGLGGSLAYSTSKAAVVALTRALAEEGVKACCVAPATMRTPQNAQGMPNANQEQWVPLEDVAAGIVYLLSPEAGALSGAVLTFPLAR